MKRFNLILLLLAMLFISCKDETNDTDCEPCQQINKLSQSEGQAYLETKYAEIQNIINSTPCTDGSSWEIIAIGSKACGGPTGFIARHKIAHGDDFLKKVADYTNAQEIFNKKWGAMSDCSIAVKPKKVECADGKPKLTN